MSDSSFMLTFLGTKEYTHFLIHILIPTMCLSFMSTAPVSYHTV